MSTSSDSPSSAPPLPPAYGSQYCKAYYLRQLRAFPEWKEERSDWKDADAPDALDGDQVVFIHVDLTVTLDSFHGENVLFSRVTPAWSQFCAGELGFAIPKDLAYKFTDVGADAAVAGAL